MQQARRLLEVEQREPDPVDAAGDGVPDAVVDEQPALRGAQRRRAETDAHRVPPGALARAQHLLGRAPAHQVGRSRQQDLGAAAAELVARPVEEHPLAVDPVRQQRGVLVVGLADDAAALDAAEVLRRGEVDGGPGRPVGGAGDHPVAELRHEDDARILEAPLLADDARGGREQGQRVDRPTVDAIGRAGGRQVRDAPQVLDARQDDRRPVGETRCRGVEDGVDRVGPVLGLQNRVRGMSAEELAVGGHAAVVAAVRVRLRRTAGRPAASSRSAARCSSSVDSAPWLSFVASSPRPSLQPPVAKS